MDLLRFTDVDTKKIYDRFDDNFVSPAGYFELFICWKSAGDIHRQTIGVYNLFEPRDREIEIGKSSDSDKPFTAQFTR
jgi:hypothetical protein